MTFTFVLTKRQHWAASRAVVRRTLAYKLGWAFFGGVPVLILVVDVAGGTSVWDAIATNPFGILAGPFAMLVAFPLLQYWSVAKYHRNFPTLQGEQSFTLTAAHLSMRGPLHNTHLDWRAVTRVVETPSFLLFYISKATAYFIPKTAIPPNDLNQVRDQLTQWLPGRVAFQTSPVPVLAA